MRSKLGAVELKARFGYIAWEMVLYHRIKWGMKKAELCKGHYWMLGYDRNKQKENLDIATSRIHLLWWIAQDWLPETKSEWNCNLLPFPLSFQLCWHKRQNIWETRLHSYQNPHLAMWHMYEKYRVSSAVKGVQGWLTALNGKKGPRIPVPAAFIACVPSKTIG